MLTKTSWPLHQLNDALMQMPNNVPRIHHGRSVIRIVPQIMEYGYYSSKTQEFMRKRKGIAIEFLCKDGYYTYYTLHCKKGKCPRPPHSVLRDFRSEIGHWNLPPQHLESQCRSGSRRDPSSCDSETALPLKPGWWSIGMPKNEDNEGPNVPVLPTSHWSIFLVDPGCCRYL